VFEILKQFREGLLWRRLREVSAAVQVEEGNFARPFDYDEWIESGEISAGRKPLVLHHYTGVEGLQGILVSNKLFATAAYYLNDSSEVEYGTRLVFDVLEKWREANERNHGFAANVLRIFYAILHHPESREVRSETIFVACFCYRENLLSQWRAYGQKGGYSLGFKVSGRSIDLAGPSPFSDLRLARVQYSR